MLLTYFVFQVPFDLAVKQVLEQLKDVAKGEYKTPDTEKRKFGNIVFAAVTLPVTEVTSMLGKVMLHFICFNMLILSQVPLKLIVGASFCVYSYLSLISC